MIKKSLCFIVDKNDRKNVFPTLGERFWNDSENIVCAPIAELTDKELFSILGDDINLKDARGAMFLIADMGDF